MAKKTIKDPAAEPAHEPWMVASLMGFYVLAVVFVSVHVGSALSAVGGRHQNVPFNPVAIIADLARGKLKWPRGGTVVAVLILGATVAAVVMWRRWKARGTEGRLSVDDKGDFMASGGQLEAMTEEAVRKKATDLGVRGPGGRSLTDADAPGVCIGFSTADDVKLYGSYEDLHLDIWGPRQGKSTSRVIPAILEAIGPVIATSNKRDVVDATRDVRDVTGHPVYVFDPQGVAGEPPTWYWDPLAWVRGAGDDLAGAEIRAAKLAGHFADSEDGQDAKADAFFDPEGEDLLAGLFLAAALENKPINQVWEWISQQQNDYPAQFLRNEIGDNYPPATGLVAQYNAEERTKSGIFGTAKKMARCLRLTNIYDWVSPRAGGVQLDELDLIERGGTLYCLSLEGRGSAGALVSALTEAVIDVAMRKAARSPGGRLPTPMLAVLDEAANVVRWKDLPKQYSHFGSRGIVVMTVLQSWAQGVRCWGPDGMNAMWGAANIRVLGSGVDDTTFLRERSEAIGDNDSISKSVSRSSGGKSYSESLSSGRTFSVADLISLPRGRVIVFPSGGKPALVRTVPWWEGPFVQQVNDALARRDPGRHTDMTDLVGERLEAANQTNVLPAQEAPSL